MEKNDLKVLELQIGTETLYILRSEIWQRSKIFKRLKRATEAAIFNYGTSLIVVDIGMSAKLSKRELVDVKTQGRGGDSEERFCRSREILYLVELPNTDIATKPVPILDNAASKIAAYAGNKLELSSVGDIQIHILARLQLTGTGC